MKVTLSEALGGRLGGDGLAEYLDGLGMAPGARSRVLEIGRELAAELTTPNSDAERCASLVLEAADIVAGWISVRHVGEAFDFDTMDWGDADEEE